MTDYGQTCSEHSIEVPAPKDAEGCKVPLDTKKLYDDEGVSYEVCGLLYRITTATCEADWTVEIVTAWNNVRQVSLDSMYLEKPDSLKLEKPDSLKQLAEDLNRMVNCKRRYGYSSQSCAYTGNFENTCDGCKLKDSPDICSVVVIKDIAARVNRLCGDSE